MKDYLKAFIATSIPFGAIMGVVFSILYGLPRGVFSGTISGILFGLIITVFIEIQKKKFKKNSYDITKGKTIIFDGAANHFVGKEGVGGWLFLTTEEVIFKSHPYNINVHELFIPLTEISEVKVSSTIGLIPNGLQIITNTGAIEKFVVNNRKIWVQKIIDAIS